MVMLNIILIVLAIGLTTAILLQSSSTGLGGVVVKNNFLD
jgi:preprotein translocase subunit SecG